MAWNERTTWYETEYGARAHKNMTSLLLGEQAL